VAREKTGDDDDGKRFRPLPRTDVIVRAGAPIDLSDFRRQLVDGALLREATEVRQGPAPIGFFDPGEYGVQAS
jgi:1-acyl-sn-glycerol-3-phosphate acyltransferase